MVELSKESQIKHLLHGSFDLRSIMPQCASAMTHEKIYISPFIQITDESTISLAKVHGHASKRVDAEARRYPPQEVLPSFPIVVGKFACQFRHSDPFNWRKLEITDSKIVSDNGAI